MVEQNIDSKTINPLHLESIGGLMNRHLKQLDLQSKLNYQLANKSHERAIEFLQFQKLLVVSQEIGKVDHKYFMAICKEKNPKEAAA
jgi:hypothetical protein